MVEVKTFHFPREVHVEAALAGADTDGPRVVRGGRLESVRSGFGAIGQGSYMSQVDESASPGSELGADAGGLRVVRGGRLESRELAIAGGTATQRSAAKFRQ